MKLNAPKIPNPGTNISTAKNKNPSSNKNNAQKIILFSPFKFFVA